MLNTPSKKTNNGDKQKNSRNKAISEADLSKTPSFDCVSQDQYLSELQRCLQLSMSHRKQLESQRIIQSNRLNMLKVKEKCLNSKFENAVKKLDKVKNNIASKKNNNIMKENAKDMNKKLLESKKAIIMEKRNVTSTPRQTSSLKKNAKNKKILSSSMIQEKTKKHIEETKEIKEIVARKENFKKILADLIKFKEKKQEAPKTPKKGVSTNDYIKTSSSKYL